ncbi:TetR/AcrR family transcriptional regulator [Microlunatus speluncae]|uniref:TetR/AcrR family transcriptional regulator n=1 Tax=Microlunatus speluncae TaxID=2594267 RepID=UPI001C2DB547|nr:TetR/AcrR family transcriptional regulator [Microlunatus speluncae]
MAENALDRMAPERRRRLIRVAAEEFAGAGYDRASLNVIIKRCGLSKSSFYHVIASKQELFDRVVRDLAAELVERIRIPAPEELSGDAFWPGVDAIFARLLEAAGEDQALVALGRMLYGPGAADEQVTSATWSAVEGWIDAALLVGRDSGAVRDDLPSALQRRLVFAVLRAMDEWSLTQPDVADLESLARAQYEAIRRLLGT